MQPESNSRPPVTVPSLRAMKERGEKIVVVTAYDASFAAAAESAGIDVVLVGDSLGMVVQGNDSTLPVTVDQIVYHTAAAARGLDRALLIADMPFLSARDVPTALSTARRLMGEGNAAMVKLEGSGWASDVIRALSERDVPVCAHLGLTPQSVDVVVVRGINHLLVPAKTGEVSEYGTLTDRTVSHDLTKAVGDWLTKTFAAAK